MAFEEFIEVGTEYAWWMLSEREAKYNTIWINTDSNINASIK